MGLKAHQDDVKPDESLEWVECVAFVSKRLISTLGHLEGPIERKT
jgi:hypothetical protein